VPLKVEIAAAGWADQEPHVYIEGKAISIRCVIRNVSRRPQLVELKDHDAYHGTLRYPVGITAKVVRESGEVLTQNEIDRSGEGWWSQYFVWSTTFNPRMPGDTITIPPGEVVIRLIPLDQVIEMHPNLRSGLRSGTYTVQLRLHLIKSNSLTIRIGQPR